MLVVVFIITAYLLWYLTKNSMTSMHSVVIEHDGEVQSSEWTNQHNDCVKIFQELYAPHP